jgi:UDP-N-acetylmuramyl pentapeptide phosphotransferase/UDP-N-acetylglucosamine-1-phosphate transferase
MIQRIQTVFWFIAVILILVYSFQVYDSVNDFRNYQHPELATLTGLTIIALLLATFSFHRRKRQSYFSAVAMVLLLIQGIELVRMSNEIESQSRFVSFILLGLVLFFNICGTIALGRDIKLLEQSSRLR